MRVRPLLVSAVCSTVAASALVISEGALSTTTHAPLPNPPQARSGGGPPADSAQGPGSTFDTGQSDPSADSQTDQQPYDQPPSGGGSGQPSSGGGGVDPGGLAQMLPVPPPIKVGP